VIFVSKKTYEKSKIIYPKFKNKFHFIPNFIEKKVDFKEELLISNDIKKILFI
jgi:hypothetical protein